MMKAHFLFSTLILALSLTSCGKKTSGRIPGSLVQGSSTPTASSPQGSIVVSDTGSQLVLTPVSIQEPAIVQVISPEGVTETVIVPENSNAQALPTTVVEVIVLENKEVVINGPVASQELAATQESAVTQVTSEPAATSESPVTVLAPVNVVYENIKQTESTQLPKDVEVKPESENSPSVEVPVNVVYENIKQTETAPLPAETEIKPEVEVVDTHLIKEISDYLKNHPDSDKDNSEVTGHSKLDQLKKKLQKRIASLEKKLNAFKNKKNSHETVAKIKEWELELFELKVLLRKVELSQK